MKRKSNDLLRNSHILEECLVSKHPESRIGVKGKIPGTYMGFNGIIIEKLSSKREDIWHNS